MVCTIDKREKDWCSSFKYKFIPNETEIHVIFNRLRDFAKDQQRHPHDWGTQLFNGLIFSSSHDLLTKFEEFRDINSKDFIDPLDINKDNLPEVFRWIEKMLRVMLRKWRIPIAATWLQNLTHFSININFKSIMSGNQMKHKD
jgi:hypothetical protein